MKFIFIEVTCAELGRRHLIRLDQILHIEQTEGKEVPGVSITRSRCAITVGLELCGGIRTLACLQSLDEIKAMLREAGK